MGDMPESQKQVLAVQFLNVVGVDWMRKFMNGSSPQTFTPLIGSQSTTFTNNPSPLELFVNKAQLFENGRMSEEDFKRASVDYLHQMRDEYKKTEPNGAIQNLKDGFTRLIAPPEAEKNVATR
jgi:hypothetical protein